MRLVWRFGTPRRSRDVDEYAAAFDLHWERRHAILFESRLTDARATMELPTMPGTNNEIAVETALAERPSDVIADIRHCAEVSIFERDRQDGGSHLPTLQRGPRDFLGAANVDPFLITGHISLPILVPGPLGAHVMSIPNNQAPLRDCSIGVPRHPGRGRLGYFRRLSTPFPLDLWSKPEELTLSISGPLCAPIADIAADIR
jgi:hypothetical protein